MNLVKIYHFSSFIVKIFSWMKLRTAVDTFRCLLRFWLTGPVGLGNLTFLEKRSFIFKVLRKNTSAGQNCWQIFFWRYEGGGTIRGRTVKRQCLCSLKHTLLFTRQTTALPLMYSLEFCWYDNKPQNYKPIISSEIPNTKISHREKSIWQINQIKLFFIPK